MKYLLTSKEMKYYDQYTIETMGIPAMVLMERAAMCVFHEIIRRFSPNTESDFSVTSVLIMVGMGNNGADGLALARMLSEAKYEVDVCCVGNQEHATKQWKQQYSILMHYPVNLFWSGTDKKCIQREYTIVVDGLFGIGLSRRVEEKYLEAIRTMNSTRGYKIALDIPSGLDTNTGEVLGEAVQADLTITFGVLKRGLVFGCGPDYTGELVIGEIGISEIAFATRRPQMFYKDNLECCMSQLLPQRAKHGNKGTFGKLMLFAGDYNMAGAAILSARAAYRVGAGMVKVITAKENRVIIQETVPEALLGTIGDWKESVTWADVVAIGPGMGKSDVTYNLLRDLLKETTQPLVIDADGLNLLAENEYLCQLLMMSATTRDIILTPHVGELSRLTGKSVEELKKDLANAAMELAKELHVTVVAKDANTFICKENHPICVNFLGNSGMATAGSGDVLAGIIAGLLAQGMASWEAACNGVYLHAIAGDMFAVQNGEHALMASDLIKTINVIS